MRGEIKRFPEENLKSLHMKTKVMVMVKHPLSFISFFLSRYSRRRNESNDGEHADTKIQMEMKFSFPLAHTKVKAEMEMDMDT